MGVRTRNSFNFNLYSISNYLKIKLDSYRFFTVYIGMNCDKCKKLKAVVKYKNGNYCTWYCAKKK